MITETGDRFRNDKFQITDANHLVSVDPFIMLLYITCITILVSYDIPIGWSGELTVKVDPFSFRSLNFSMVSSDTTTDLMSQIQCFSCLLRCSLCPLIK